MEPTLSADAAGARTQSTTRTWHPNTAEARGSFSLHQQLVPAGFSSAPAVHPEQDSILFVLEGQLAVTIDGVTSSVRSGGTAAIPSGVSHHFQAELPTRFVQLEKPAGTSEFYVDLRQLAASSAARTSVAPTSPTDLARVVTGAHAGKVQIKD